MPEPRVGLLNDVEGLDQVDERVRREFAFKDSEWVLVRDLCDYTIPDFKGDETSAGRRKTLRTRAAQDVAKREPQLSEYCHYFLRVLRAGFGQDKTVCATLFQDTADSPLPVRLVAIHLDWPRDEEIVVEPIDSADLCDRLMALDERWLQAGDKNRGGIFYQRVAMVYSEYRYKGRSIPTVYIIKPDRIRYWTRSAALRDADEVAADVQLWRQQTPPRGKERS
jgi:hypothetical protein